MDLEVLHHAGIGRDPTAADPASSLPGPGPASVFWTAGQLLVFLPYVPTCRSLSLQCQLGPGTGGKETRF